MLELAARAAGGAASNLFRADWQTPSRRSLKSKKADDTRQVLGTSYSGLLAFAIS